MRSGSFRRWRVGLPLPPGTAAGQADRRSPGSPALRLASRLLPTFSIACLPAGGAAEAKGFPHMSDIKNLSDASFEQDVLKSPLPVLVDYWAEWCGPCRMIAPIVAEVAGEYQGRLTVAKLNVDENQVTPGKYGIRGIPTLMLFKNGTVAGTRVGQLSKPQLIAFIDSNL
jgi:thioredoxin 1